jgi:hypothetical protein
LALLLEKSKSNFDAAMHLKSSGFYCSIVHCSYYSCIQRMLHIKQVFFNESPEDLMNRCEREGKGSHVILTNEIKNALRDKGNYSECQTFNSILGTLKRNRTDADYNDVQILKEKSEASIGFAAKINSILDRNFK